MYKAIVIIVIIIIIIIIIIVIIQSSAESLGVFKTALKTFLFSKRFS